MPRDLGRRRAAFPSRLQPPATDLVERQRLARARGICLTDSARGLTRVSMYAKSSARHEVRWSAGMPVTIRRRAYVLQRAAARVARPARRTAGTIRWSDFPISTGGGDAAR